MVTPERVKSDIMVYLPEKEDEGNLSLLDVKTFAPAYGSQFSKLEEKELKKVRRRIKNKISAQESRRRKKEYIDTLENRARIKDVENDELKKKIKSLEIRMRSLVDEMFLMKQEPVNAPQMPDQTCLLKQTKSVTRATQTGMCLQCFFENSRHLSNNAVPTHPHYSNTTYRERAGTYCIPESSHGFSSIGYHVEEDQFLGSREQQVNRIEFDKKNSHTYMPEEKSRLQPETVKESPVKFSQSHSPDLEEVSKSHIYSQEQGHKDLMHKGTNDDSLVVYRSENVILIKDPPIRTSKNKKSCGLMSPQREKATLNNELDQQIDIAKSSKKQRSTTSSPRDAFVSDKAINFVSPDQNDLYVDDSMSNQSESPSIQQLEQRKTLNDDVFLSPEHERAVEVKTHNRIIRHSNEMRTPDEETKNMYDVHSSLARRVDNEIRTYLGKARRSNVESTMKNVGCSTHSLEPRRCGNEARNYYNGIEGDDNEAGKIINRGKESGQDFTTRPTINESEIVTVALYSLGKPDVDKIPILEKDFAEQKRAREIVNQMENARALNDVASFRHLGKRRHHSDTVAMEYKDGSDQEISLKRPFRPRSLIYNPMLWTHNAEFNERPLGRQGNLTQDIPGTEERITTRPTLIRGQGQHASLLANGNNFFRKKNIEMRGSYGIPGKLSLGELPSPTMDTKSIISENQEQAKTSRIVDDGPRNQRPHFENKKGGTVPQSCPVKKFRKETSSVPTTMGHVQSRHGFHKVKHSRSASCSNFLQPRMSLIVNLSNATSPIENGSVINGRNLNAVEDSSKPSEEDMTSSNTHISSTERGIKYDISMAKSKETFSRRSQDDTLVNTKCTNEFTEITMFGTNSSDDDNAFERISDRPKTQHQIQYLEKIRTPHFSDFKSATSLHEELQAENLTKNSSLSTSWTQFGKIMQPPVGLNEMKRRLPPDGTDKARPFLSLPGWQPPDISVFGHAMLHPQRPSIPHLSPVDRNSRSPVMSLPLAYQLQQMSNFDAAQHRLCASLPDKTLLAAQRRDKLRR